MPSSCQQTTKRRLKRSGTTSWTRTGSITSAANTSSTWISPDIWHSYNRTIDILGNSIITIRTTGQEKASLSSLHVPPAERSSHPWSSLNAKQPSKKSYRTGTLYIRMRKAGWTMAWWISGWLCIQYKAKLLNETNQN